MSMDPSAMAVAFINSFNLIAPKRAPRFVQHIAHRRKGKGPQKMQLANGKNDNCASVHR